MNHYHYNPYLFYYQQYLQSIYLSHHLMNQNLHHKYTDRIPYSEVNNGEQQNSNIWKIKSEDIIDLGLEGVLIKGDSSKLFKDIFINVNESFWDDVKCRIKINSSGEAEIICDF